LQLFYFFFSLRDRELRRLTDLLLEHFLGEVFLDNGYRDGDGDGFVSDSSVIPYRLSLVPAAGVVGLDEEPWPCSEGNKEDESILVSAFKASSSISFPLSRSGS